MACDIIIIGGLKMQSKKQLILLILNELNINSDEKHPLSQTQIAKNLSGEKFTCDRKTVCRNIKFLQEMGYPIKKSSKGFYFDKTFSVDDIAFVKAAIFSADGRSESEKESIAKKVVDVLTKQYRR
jgi:biotin operon repressor